MHTYVQQFMSNGSRVIHVPKSFKHKVSRYIQSSEKYARFDNRKIKQDFCIVNKIPNKNEIAIVPSKIEMDEKSKQENDFANLQFSALY